MVSSSTWKATPVPSGRSSTAWSRGVAVARPQRPFTGGVKAMGCRPSIPRLGTKLGLTAPVRNDVHGVFLGLKATAGAVGPFFARVRTAPPPLARVDDVVV